MRNSLPCSSQGQRQEKMQRRMRESPLGQRARRPSQRDRHQWSACWLRSWIVAWRTQACLDTSSTSQSSQEVLGLVVHRPEHSVSHRRGSPHRLPRGSRSLARVTHRKGHIMDKPFSKKSQDSNPKTDFRQHLNIPWYKGGFSPRRCKEKSQGKLLGCAPLCWELQRK